MRNLLKIFFEEHLADPNRTIFSIYNTRSQETANVSAGQFSSSIKGWQRKLSDVPQDIIPIFGRMNLEATSAYFAAISLGKTPTFLSYPNFKTKPELFQKRLSNYQTKLDTKFFIGAKEDRELLGEMIICPELNAEHSPQSSLALDCQDIHRTLFLQCSSGTTGLQKAMPITTSQLCEQLENYSKTIGLGSSDHIASWLPLYHDMGLIAAFLMPLLLHVPVTYIDTFDWVLDPSSLLSVIENQKASFSWLPNFSFALLAKCKPGFDLSSMKSFVNCSEPVTENGMKLFGEQHAVPPEKFSICYALAENVFAVSQTNVGRPIKFMVDPENPARKLGICGKVMQGTEVSIRSLHEGSLKGEIFIRGTSVINGYLGQAPKGPEEWLTTGDIGCMLDGELSLCGREKDLIIHRGKNIFPQELENEVYSFSQVQPGRAVAVGLYEENDETENILVLWEPRGFISYKMKQQVSAQIAQRLENIFDVSVTVKSVPKAWLEKTSSGKIARESNLQRYHKAAGQKICIVGDSHVRIFWTNFESHLSELENVHGIWVGPLWADSWGMHIGTFLELFSTLGENDILIIQAGEPEGRAVFPGDENPSNRILQSVSAYAMLLNWIKSSWNGKLAFMTGPPTDGTTHIPENKVDPVIFPIIGTPDYRYACQRAFSDSMVKLCSRLDVPCLDIFTYIMDFQFAGAPFLPEHVRLDGSPIHIKKEYVHFYYDLIDNTFGFIGSKAKHETEIREWDGSFEHFVKLCTNHLKIEQVEDISSPEPIFNQVDSLGLVQFIGFLEKKFQAKIVLEHTYREHFDTLANVYNKFIAEKEV